MEQATETGKWVPEWAVHPGAVLADHLSARGWSQAEFARRADLTPKHVSTIVGGSNPVTAETAIRLERVLGMQAYIWTDLQSKWDIHEARRREAKLNLREELRRYPVKELKSRGVLPETNEPVKLADSLLAFLGIGRFPAFSARFDELAVHNRQSGAHHTAREHVACWLLLGEQKARKMEMPKFDVDRFEHAVQEIRALTNEKPRVFEPRMKDLCLGSGVALIFEKPIRKTSLYGSARWLEADRAIIQMSLRMKTNDHFWWTFFHEAAHIVLHRGRTFVDDQGGKGDGVEAEADLWAEETLVGRDRFAAFKARCLRSEVDVRAFAREVQIHPGIDVGMLQHAGGMPFRNLNKLKDRFDWVDELPGS